MWPWSAKTRRGGKDPSTESPPADHRRQENLFTLESLEPRLLLSGDPVLAELARWSQDDAGSDSNETPAVIVQEIDQTLSAQAGAADEDSPVTVEWPAGWQVADETAAPGFQIRIEAQQEGRIDLSATIEALVDQVLGLSDGTGQLAAEIAMQIRDSAGQPGSDTLELLAPDGTTDENGNPVQSTLSISTEQLNAILDQVLERRAEDGIAGGQSDLTIRIADLEDGVVAEYRDGVIYLDITAAGQGWYLTMTPHVAPADASDSDAASLSPEPGSGAGQLSQQIADGHAGATVATGDGQPVEESTAGLTGAALEHSAQSVTSLESASEVSSAAPETAAAAAHGATTSVDFLDAAHISTTPDQAADGNGDAALSHADHRAGLFELLTAALGMQDSTQDGTDIHELVVGILAASHRLQEDNRSSQRNELRKHNNRNSDTDTDNTGSVSPATVSTAPSGVDSSENATPRGPPAITEVQTVSDAENTDTSQQDSPAPLYYQQDPVESDISEANPARAPPADDHIPSASDDVADMPRAPPVDDENSVIPLTAPSGSETDPTEETTHDEVEYLNSTGTPSGVIGEDLAGADFTTDARLQALIAEAIQRWTDSGLIPAGADLSTLSYAVDNLVGDALGSYNSATRTITIDGDADGFGWFVDETPDTDTDVGALPGVDLLTVLMHEMGHALDYAHSGEAGLEGNTIMVATLGDGARLAIGIAEGANLDDVIDILLATFDRTTPPVGEIVFTSADGDIPGVMTLGETINGGVDLRLEQVTLTFSGLHYNTAASHWEGFVGIEAETGALQSLGYNAAITDSTDDGTEGSTDADNFAITGVVSLAPGTAATLNLDVLAAEIDLEIPVWIEHKLSDFSVEFTDFRGNDNQNVLGYRFEILGFDTGVPALNDLLKTENPFLELRFEGFVENTLDLVDVEAVLGAGPYTLDAIKAGIRANTTYDGGGVKITGHLFKVFTLELGFIMKTVEHQGQSVFYAALAGRGELGSLLSPGNPAGNGSDSGSGGSGSGGSGGGDVGDRGVNIEVAIAISQLGPLQIYAGGGPIDLPQYGITLETIAFGVRFHTTIEDMQVEMDFLASDGSWDPATQLATLTIPEHDLDLGDRFRVVNADNDNFNGVFEVTAVADDVVFFEVEEDPGPFTGSAEVTRLTIKDGRDLDDDGLESGIAPPDSLLDWEAQLDAAVINQIENGSETWTRMFGEVTFGGKATVSFVKIPDWVLLLDVDLLIDTEGQIFLSGAINIFDEVFVSEIALFADLGDLGSGNAQFLFLWSVLEVPVFDPLVQLYGILEFGALDSFAVLDVSVTENSAEGTWTVDLTLPTDNPSEFFTPGETILIQDYELDGATDSEQEGLDGVYEITAVDDATNTITFVSSVDPGTWLVGTSTATLSQGSGFFITIGGGADLNIPGIDSDGNAVVVSTLTLAGDITLEVITPPSTEDEELQIRLDTDVTLSESNFGTIGTANGELQLLIDTDLPLIDSVSIFGAMLVDLDTSFTEQFGLFVDVSAMLVFNTGAQDQDPILLQTAMGVTVSLTPTAKTFQLRLDGSMGLRVDFNDNGSFESSEQLFLLTGVFVFSFSNVDGLNVVLFSESGDPASPVIDAATLELGPAGSPWLQFKAFGFLAIQQNSVTGHTGVAANLILSLDASAPGTFFTPEISVDAQFVMLFNTIGEDVSFDIPAGLNNPSLSGQPSGLTVHIPRAPPESIVGASLDILDLISGNAWTLDDSVIGGAYLLIHLGGTDPAQDPDAHLNVGPFSLSGQISFLLGFSVAADGSVSPLLEIIGHVNVDIGLGDSLTLFQLEGDAFIRFDSSGLVAAINMTQRAGAAFPSADLGFSLSTSFRLELNTTTSSFDHDGNGATPGIAPGLRLHMDGTMDLAGVLVLTGTFDLTSDLDGVHIRINGYFELFGIRANMDATANLDLQGFDLSTRLSLATGDGLSIAGLPISISGGFTLYINTRTGTFFISVHDANDVNKGAMVNMMGLVMKGSMTIGISQGTFSIHVPKGTASDPGDPLQLNFFDVAQLEVYGDLSFNVLTGAASFVFNASAGMTIGIPGVLGVSATLTLGFDSTNGSFTSSVKGTAWIAGISFSVDASLRISGTAISLKLSITVTITPSFRIWIPFVGTKTVPALRATYSNTFNIGTLTPAEEFAAPVPAPPVLAHVENGILYLHMGIDEPLRDPNDDWDDNDINESFRVTHLGGTAGNESLIVEAFGFRSADGEFTGVSKIVVTNAGDGEDVVDIAAGVLADAEVHGGIGNDRISYAGSGRAMLYGDEGDDFLMGGSGGTMLDPDILEGGADNDRLQGGSGYSNVFGEGGDDTIIWSLASGAKLQLIDGGSDTGGDFRDTLQVLGSAAGESASVSALAGGGFSVSINGSTATAGAIESLILDMMRGSDTVTVNDVSASTLTNVIVRLGQITEQVTDPDTGLPMTTVLNPDDDARDHVIVQASSGDDNITLEDINGDTIAINYNNLVTIAVEHGDATGGNLTSGDLLSIYGNGGNDSIDASQVMTLLLNMQFFLGNEGGSILGSDFADTIEITVNGNTTGNLQLDGKGGADSYIINLKGGDTDALITISDSGANGGDSVEVNGTGGAEIITLSNVQFRQGANSEVLNYSGLETFTINSLGGNDDITIFSTSPSTTTVVNSGEGNDRIAIRSVTNSTTINTGSGDDEVRVGSAATVTTNANGTANSINALLTVNGGANSDSLYIDDSADALANTDGQLTANLLTGLGMASGISYSELESLALDLGTGSDIFLVVSVHANTATTVRASQGSDTITIRNASGTLNDIDARLTVDGGNSGSDTDTLAIDDSGDGGNNTDGVLSSIELTGLGTANGIGYSGFTDIEVHLGSGADVFTIESTHDGTTLLDANGGNDVINVQAISGATTVIAGTGSDHINVGSNADGTSGTPTANSNGTLNDIGALLTIDGEEPASGSDTLTIDDTADGTPNEGMLTANMLTGLDMTSGISYSHIEHLIISLGNGGNSFTIEDTHGAATSPFEETTTLDSGNGADIVHVNGATDQLTVNAQNENDIINVRAMIGTVVVNGDAGNDTVNVSSQSPTLPASATDQAGTVDGIDGLLTVNGGIGTDTLNVDDSDPAVTGKSAVLTASTLRGLAMPEGINYGTLDTLNIWLDAGNNTFDIDGTHDGTTNVYSMEGDDTINVRATAAGSTTSIHSQGDDDTINITDMAPTLPADYPASLPPAAADTAGSIDAINGLVVINGGLDDDTINIDDSASIADKSGKLTETTLRGLALEGGINYSDTEDMTIWLGTGTDTFYIDSTHAGTTQLYAGDGNTTAGQRDDTIAIRSISGVTTVHAQGGNDGILVNVEYDGGLPALVGVDAANDAQFVRTHENNIGAVLNLHGEGGSDHYTVNLAGTGNALINVHDLGAENDGNDALVINGADTVPGVNNQPNDTFLLRLDFVALLNDADTGDELDFDSVERVNYDAQINAGLTVNGLGGDDAFYSDDNSTTTTLNGGSGADSFQIGQVFGTGRTTDANIAPGDTFDTTPVIIGVVRHPVTNEVVFNPVEDELDADARAAILAAIAAAGVDQPVAGIAYVSNGISHHTEINGGSGNDSFSVYHNKATLAMNGEGDNDDFIVRAFVVLVGLQQGEAQVNGGAGGDSIQYTQNAPVTIDGGDGFDTIVVLGTPFRDSFVVTSTGIFGAGLAVFYKNVESVELDTLENADTIYVLSTSADLVTTIIAGQGSDTINIMGDAVNTIVTSAEPDLSPRDQDLGSIQGALIVEGGPLADRDRSLAAAVVLPGESNPVSDQESPLTDEAQNIDTLNIFHTDNLSVQSGALVFRDQNSGIVNPGLALTGFGMDDTLIIDPNVPGEPDLVYGGGITYNGFEIVELLLGSAGESLDIHATADGAITAVHGGGGSDTINVYDRGNGPLVIYGDTSEDGVRYSNDNSTDEPSIHGSSFSNPGNDIINAAAMLEQGDGFLGVVIYGGPGMDTITGSQDDDLLIGGTDRDTINGEAGNDHIYGDSHLNVNLLLFAQDQITPFDPATQLADINAIVDIPTTGAGDRDTINGGAGNDVIFGDHGIITQVDGTRRLETNGNIVLLTTVSHALGDVDTIHGDSGNDFIFGGTAGDTLYGDAGSDLVFGDFGRVTGTVDAALTGALDGAGVQNAGAAFIYTSDTSTAADAAAGSDTIHGGSLVALDEDTGSNILLGQQGSDTIYGGGSDDDIYGGHNVANGTDSGDFIDAQAGNDVILGDNGLIEHTVAVTDLRFAVLRGSLLYDSNGNALLEATVAGSNPAGVEARRILLFDHDDSANNAGNYGIDIIAGGADDDVIFGQLGNDTLHGDGYLDRAQGALGALAASIAGADIGGDDYIEGNGGDDTILGGLGQDDLVGGSSSLYNLTSPAQRPDGTDTIFGGNADLLARNNYGETLVNEAGDTIITAAERHARDADVILGDNGNIYRLTGINSTDSGSFLTFAYDNYASNRIVVRATQLLDYTPGGSDFDPVNAANDIGAGDIIHGEAGDDAIYGMVGNDILYGEAQDDDLVGGYGHDWISGGTGTDGVLGDDGRIYTSRNSAGDPALLSEPLYGIHNVVVDRNSDTLELRTPGDLQQAFVNKLGELTKSVNLTPFNVAPDNGAQDPRYDAQHADDIIYGGLGDDFLHGGAGDDAISGAEALAIYYLNPVNNGDVLRYGGERAGEFAAYNEFDPLRHILVDANGVHTDASDPNAREFLLNFDAFDSNSPNDPYATGTGYAAVPTDGDDRLFGDLGNDWLVGGTGRDHLYGGWGDDLLNADDNHASTAGSADPRANNLPDSHPSYEDIAYGGAGRDVLIANTGGDRLIDWVGEFNSYLVPFAPYGAFTISRSIQPQMMEYLYDLSKADGADQTRAADTGAEALRNGEPEGELGLVMQKDLDWQDQTGAPDDIQPGNIPGGARDVIRAADFNNDSTVAFAADSGSWTVEGGRLQIAPDYLGGDAVSVFYVDSALPSYFEMRATINAGKPTAGLKSNTYLIFDYQSPTDFKFAGINISTDKLVMGHRTAEGWIVDEQTPARLKPGQDYNVLLALNGTVATLVVNNTEVFSHVYATRTDIYGVSYGLNAGMVGIGAENSIGAIDNVAVQVLPPELTLDDNEDFTDGVADRLTGLMTGQWAIINDRYAGQPAAGAAFATSALDVSVAPAYVLRLETTLQTQGIAGLVFDQYSADDFKFAALSVATDEIIIGHYTARSGWQVDASIGLNLQSGKDYDLEITLNGTTINVALNGQTVLGHAFNAPLVDGAAGLLAGQDGATFDSVTVQTNDPQYLDSLEGQALLAAGTPDSSMTASNLQAVQLAAMIDAAILRWQDSGLLDAARLEALADVDFVITDLPGATLGIALADTIYIDSDAAGFGWFVDSTPADDAEFTDPDGDGSLSALAGSAADGRMDLLSVVTHELGHVLGYGHADADDSLMSESLVAGNRTPGTMDAGVVEVTDPYDTSWWEALVLTASNIIAAHDHAWWR